MSLRAMKNAHEPVVAGLAVMIQEQQQLGLAGMDPTEICTNMQEICKEYAVICEKYAQNMATYRLH